MKCHLAFYHNSTGLNGKDFNGPSRLIEACGSDSVAVMDGRYGHTRLITEGKRIAKERGYLAFQIRKGDSFSRCQCASNIILVSEKAANP